MTEGTAEYPRPYDGYLLLEHIGTGGMSEVDLACRSVEDASYVRFMVIKRMVGDHVQDESFVRMFTDEARITAELHHENIAQVYDFGKVTSPGTGRAEYFLAMEYVAGPDLRVIQRRCISKGQRIPVRFSLAVVHEVLAALEYAHTRRDPLGNPMQIVHRDVNPRNVMVSVGGEVKLIDFGVAFAGDLFRSERTTGKGLKGKWAYMSPEQIEHTTSLDGRSDLFAVGLMLHELIELRSPFAGLNEVQIMHRVLNNDIEPLIALGTCAAEAAIQAVHRRALERNRDDRYPSAKAMREDILAAAELLGGMMTREERAAYLKGIAPDVVTEISERMRLYRSGIPKAPPARRVRDVSGRDEDVTVPGVNSIVTYSGLFDPDPGKRRRARSVAVVVSVLLVALALWVFPETGLEGTGPEVTPVVPQENAEQLDDARGDEVVEEASTSSADVETAAVPAEKRKVQPRKVRRNPDQAAVSVDALETAGGEATETSDESSDETTTLVEEQPVEMGLLVVVSSPPAQVYVDDVLIGTTPIQNRPFPVGVRKVKLVDPAGRPYEESVTISARQVSAVRHSFNGATNSSGRQR